MQVIEIRIAVAGLGDALGAMRDWLDRNKCGAVRFETATEPPAAVRVRLEFAEPGWAEAFGRQFGSTPMSAAA